MLIELPILSISIFLPLCSSICIIFLTTIYRKNKLTYKRACNTSIYIVAILSSTLTLASSISLFVRYNSTIGSYQFIEKYIWIEPIGLNFHIGVDAFSINFIVLTAILTLLCIIYSIFTIKKNIAEYLLCFLVLESFCIGVFSALNLLLFYGFFEATLIPMYLVIGTWGGQKRVYAAVKFFLYTFLGSMFLLVSLIYIFIQTGTFEFIDLVNTMPLLPIKIQQYLWISTFISFAIKVPMLPFHTWLPDAHVEAPTAGSVMLAGILLKIGGYAFLRISLPMLPQASKYFSVYIMYLSGFAIIYASLIAIIQKDIKRMIAYSSIAHMGYVTSGIFSLTTVGISGAVFQMISHGVISSALFFIVGILYNRHCTKLISRYGGVAYSMPILAIFFMLAILGSIGLPGLSGFIGEILCIIGVFSVNPIIGIICGTGIVLSAVYMLKLYKCLMLGESNSKSILSFKDLAGYEIVTLLPLIALVIYIGLNPSMVLNAIEIQSQSLLTVYTTI